MTQSRIVGISGGSCSGKTTLAQNTLKALGQDRCSIIQQDNYYFDQSGIIKQGGLGNFDHPKSVDFALLAEHIRMLKSGRAIDMPMYDFVNRRRLQETKPIQPSETILLEGILILTQQEIIDQLDLSFYIQSDKRTRRQRRLKRDITERGRSRDSVIEQFEKIVVPMHKQYVKPSKKNAVVVIGKNQCIQLLRSGADLNIDEYLKDATP